ncbi:MAG: NAD(P)-dependent oxidoreductase [Leptotrichiaceae bacterium]|nr:NAD(P)-dependent oxidoreductase [Leptotrichiaceae bacterium]
MKVAIIGANGKVGSFIVKEAVNRGHEVTAVIRDKNKSTTENFIIKDLFHLTEEDLKNFDTVITAFSAWTPETLFQHTTSLQHLSNLLSGKNIRLLVVGGAGSLYMDKDHKIQLSDTPDFPEEYKPVANAMSDGLAELRKRDDVQWTYISPAADFYADDKKTGNYIIMGEEFTVNSDGESRISYADYASAMLDEMERGNNIKKRISVLKK